MSTKNFQYYSEHWGSVPPSDSEMLRYWAFETGWFFMTWIVLMFSLTSCAIAWQINQPGIALFALLFGALIILVLRSINKRVRNGSGAVAKVSAFRGLVNMPVSLPGRSQQIVSTRVPSAKRGKKRR